MAYVTQAELEARWAGLQFATDDDASGAIDADNVTEAIENASAEIDGAACQHYETPLSLSNTNTARIVKDKVGALAVYKLAARVPPVPADLRDQYDDALAWLKDLAAGKIILAGETETDEEKPAGGIVLGGGDGRVDDLDYL